MVFPEMSVELWDPQSRYLEIPNANLKWHVREDGKLVAHFRHGVIFLQGTNGYLTYFNSLGLRNAETGQPFEIQDTPCVIL
jgi:hypothetical protein